ncbi:hypothetical protein [Desulfoferrobacter suflitae]|uniref:hypothetical protein n=1 Tax=Desulfoferrobacter suflitae TaxID=2865782 RepID=UPI0021644E57|nr:hypothetical protein [Desulfoferrobacter suflitae]MCK8603275.1 hypothetical protein [Desulfoferrobacter suflitae]
MKKITVFLFALLVGLATVAPNALATSYDPTGVPGNLPASPKTAMIWNHGNMGDALFGELYRAIAPSDDIFFGNANVVTYVSIENTSSKWVAAHVRLRTGRFSIEAIDFPIFLSPRDVFWFQFETFGKDGTQVVTIVSKDKETILKSGLDTYKPRIGYVVYDDVTGTLIMTLKTDLLKQYNMAAAYQATEELTMGHVEVFGLFSLDFPSNRKPVDNFFGVMSQLWNDDFGACLDADLICLPLSRRFASYHENGLTFADRRVPAIDVEKDLTGHVFIGDFKTGVYAGYTMKALKDFRAGVGLPGGLHEFPTPHGPRWENPISHRDLFIRGIFNASGRILVNPATILYNYGADPAYLEPDWATSFGPTWNDGDNWYGDPTEINSAPGGIVPTEGQLRQIAAVRSFSLDEVEDALYKKQISATYFNQGFELAQTYTLGVYTAPTKFLHFFFNGGSGLSGTGKYLNAWPVGSGSGARIARSAINPAGMSQIGCDAGVWNTEQLGPKDPSPLPSIVLPWETNLLPIGNRSADNLAGFGFLVTDQDAVLVRYEDGFNAGWFLLRDFFFTNGDPRCGNTPANLNDLVRSDSAYFWPVCSGEIINFFSVPPIYGYYLLSPGGSDPLAFKIPISSLVMDFEFTNYPHVRMYDPSWDNDADYDGVLGGVDGISNSVIPFGDTGYGG